MWGGQGAGGVPWRVPWEFGGHYHADYLGLFKILCHSSSFDKNRNDDYDQITKQDH